MPRLECRNSGADRQRAYEHVSGMLESAVIYPPLIEENKAPTTQ
jgi:hypothetical protein